MTPAAVPALRIAELGRLARRTLASAAPLRVLAVFARSLYVDAGDRGLVCIGGPDLGSGPLHALLASAAGARTLLARVAPGDGVRVGAGGLVLANPPVTLAWAGAADWAPPAARIDLGTLARNLVLLRQATAPAVAGEGLGFLVAGAAAPGGGLADAGVNASAAVGAWLQDHGAAPVASLARLIGLGPGLTPSGDDFLGGVLIGLHATGHSPRAAALAAALLPMADQRTNRISRAHLGAAAEGQGSGLLHACIAALFAEPSGSASVLAHCVAALARVGHTSGLDALAGVVAVLSTLAHRCGNRDEMQALQSGTT